MTDTEIMVERSISQLLHTPAGFEGARSKLFSRLLGVLVVASLLAAACTPETDATSGSSTTAASSDSVDGTDGGDGDDEASDSTGATTTAESAAPALLFAEPEPDATPLEISEDIRVGTLDNGLTYYVQSNNSPGSSVSMRLAVKAGGIDEDPLGTGAAHFLEHMMFNGTEKYPGNTLDAALRRIGAEIGPDFNAYTSDSETVYQIEVADQGDNVAVAFEVLAQWASAAIIDPDEVRREAPIVREELRLRDESGQGIINVAFEEAYYRGTPFEGVNVSGTAETVNAITPQDLRDYYDTWYRPDNMAIVAVGDRTLDELERSIIDEFSGVTTRGEAKTSPDTTLETLRSEPYVETVIEPSYGDSFISVDIPVKSWDLSTRGGNELRLTEFVLGQMINNRLNEGVDSGRLDLRRAGGGWFGWNRDLAYLGFNVDADDLEVGTEVFMTELQGSVQNPFTQGELDRAVEAVRAVQDQRLAQFGTTQDRAFADQLVGHYLGGGDLQSIDESVGLAIEILEDLTIDEVNNHYGWMMTSAAPIVLIVGPDAERVGDVENHRAGIERAAQAVVGSFDDDVEEIDELVASPEPVEEIEQLRLDKNNGVEMVFANGTRVLFAPSTISEGQVVVVSESPGGRSQLSDGDGAVANTAVATVSASGVGPWDQIQTRRYLADREVSFSPYLADFSEGFSGGAATEDLETFFQLLYLSLQEPRIDDVPFRQQVEFARDRTEQVTLNSATAAQVAVSDARTGGGPLVAAPTLRELDDLTPNDAQRIWDDRFGSLDDHVIVIVGDVEQSTVVDLARTWIGSLPNATTSDSPEQPPLPGVVNERLDVGSGSSGGSYRLLHIATLGEETVANRVLAEITTRVLNDRLFTVVREQLGATYGGNARIEFSDPGDEIELLISIDGDPARIDEIADTVIAELGQLGQGSLTDDDFDEAVAVLQSEYGFINNGYIMQSLFDEAYRSSTNVIDRTGQLVALRNISRSDITEFVFALTQGDNVIDVRNVPQ